MKYIIGLFFSLVLLSLVLSRKKILEPGNSLNSSTFQIDSSAKDSLNLSQGRSVLNDAIARIRKGQFNHDTKKLLDSAKAIYGKIERLPIKDLSNLYSYLDVFTYEARQLDENIEFNKEFIEKYKTYNNKNYSKLLMATSNLGYSLLDVGKPLEALRESIFPIKKTIDSLLNEKIADSLENQLRTAQLVNYRQLILSAQELENGKILREALIDFEDYLKQDNISEDAKQFLPYALSNLADVCIELGEYEKAKSHIEHWKSLVDSNKYIDQLMILDLESKMQKINNEISTLEVTLKNANTIYNLIDEDNPYKNIFYTSILYRITKIQLENDAIDKSSLSSRINKLLELSESNIDRDRTFALYAYDLEILKNFKSLSLDTLPYFIDEQLKLAAQFNKSDFLNKNAIHKIKFALLKNDSFQLDNIIMSFLDRNKIDSLNTISSLNQDFKNRLYGSLHTAQTSISISNLLLEQAFKSKDQQLFSTSYKLAFLAGMLVDVNKSQFNFNSLERDLINNINTNLLKCRENLDLSIENVAAHNDGVIEVLEQNTNSLLTIKNSINSIKYDYSMDAQIVMDSLNIVDAQIAQVRSNLFNSSDKEYQELQKDLDSLKLNKANILIDIKKDAYSTKLNDALGFEMAELKSKLGAKEAIIRFYDYDDLYAFLISKDQSRFFNLGSSDKIANDVSNFLKNIRGLKDIDESYNSMASHLKPILQNLKASRITIVPEGMISLLPFELFVDKTLENNITVNYNSSLKIIGSDINSETLQLASFSPAYSSERSRQNVFRQSIERSSNAYELPFALEEASYVASLFNGDLFKGKEADKETFVNMASNYQILHLAMHAYTDSDNEYDSKLLFSGNNNEDHLDLEAIYNLNIKAKLTTVSACNTGFGRIDPIEGVLSFSRAFQYAGSDATLTSLWRVPDKETSIIMKRFYENLKEGQSKSDALKGAKKYYLETTEDPNFKHPYYWAGFVLTGDTSAITSGSNYSVYIIGVLAILALLIFTIKKRLNTN